MAAESGQARLIAAADAGLAMTIYQLGLKDSTQRLRADGRVHALYFEGVNLSITVQDERGKVPLNSAGPDVERRLFAAAGVEGERLEILVDSLNDWKDSDDSARQHGAESSFYRSMGFPPRNGEIRTIDELAKIRGMDNALLERIAPAITVTKGIFGTFEPALAVPMALVAMKDRNGGQYDADRRREMLSGNQPALDFWDKIPVTGRVLAVTVLATGLDGGSSFRRDVVVQFTGNPEQPYWIRFAR
nr:type II secretion system protein GspK [Rhizomicrobium palustre]